ncbi:MAG: hypothetical protein WAQ05_26055 [Rubrivivax sp.]
MSSLNALSTATQNRLSAALSPYEGDRLKYGPAAASLIGIGSSLVDGASTVCHLSSEGLQKLAELAGGLGDAAGTAVEFVEDVADTVTDTAATVSDGVGSFLAAAGDYLALGTAALAETINEVI